VACTFKVTGLLMLQNCKRPH